MSFAARVFSNEPRIAFKVTQSPDGDGLWVTPLPTACPAPKATEKAHRFVSTYASRNTEAVALRIHAAAPYTETQSNLNKRCLAGPTFYGVLFVYTKEKLLVNANFVQRASFLRNNF
jgi:hypothetical protein